MEYHVAIGSRSTVTMSTQPPSKSKSDKEASSGERTVREVELLHVAVSRAGKQVSAQWALHPQLKQDLTAEELSEVKDLMAQVTNIVGQRFAQVLSQAEPDRPGTA